MYKENYNNKNNIISALDIGQNKIICLIASIDKLNNLKIIGRAQRLQPIISANKFLIPIAEFQALMKTVINEAEIEANSFAKNLHISIDKSNVFCYVYSKKLDIVDPEITQYHIDKLNNLIERQFYKEHPNLKIIMTINNFYTINNKFNVTSPIGLFSDSMEVNLSIYAIDKFLETNYKNMIDKTLHSIDSFIPEIYATMQGLLPKLEIRPEKEIITIIDLGQSYTEIIVMNNNKIIYKDIVNIAGKIITQDISTIFKIPFYIAEKLKILYADVSLSNNLQYNKTIKVKDFYDLSDNDSLNEQYLNIDINIDKLNIVIQDRIEEILDIIFRNIKKHPSIFSKFNNEENKLYIIGGGASIVGLDHLVANYWNKNILLSIPVPIPYKNTVITDMLYIPAIGLIVTAYKNQLYLQENYSSLYKRIITYIQRFIYRKLFFHPKLQKIFKQNF